MWKSITQKLFLLYLSVQIICDIRSVSSANILLYPYGHCLNSHLFLMEKLGSFLSQHHRVSMLINSEYSITSRTGMDLRRVQQVSFSAPKNVTTLCDLNSVERLVTQSPSDMIGVFIGTGLKFCEALLQDTATLHYLKQQRFDVIVVDSMEICGLIIAQYLKIPYIKLLTEGIGDHADIPSPMAYVPAMMATFTDKMTFGERAMNAVMKMGDNLIYYYMLYQYEQLQNKYTDIPTSVHETSRRPSLRFAVADFALDYPQPVMPDMLLIGGFFVSQPTSQMSETVEQFLDSVGEEGLVVFSFGSQVKHYGEHWGNLFASALGRLPQKVLWRYDGQPPSNLKNNTKLVPWLPQAELLAHPKTKLFITHCGRNGAMEAGYYGIPVIGIPLFADQPSMASKLTGHAGMGVALDIHSLTADKLYSTAKEVISNHNYKSSALKVSYLMRDQPWNFKEKILYWVDYVVKHDGAYHFKSQAINLKWYQSMMLDVIVFFIFLFLIVINLFMFLWRVLIPSCNFRSSVIQLSKFKMD
ncbi:UDP-glucuronosyltransferase 2C1 [Lingula anatina]|uniref:UDP-glucuronosyltransferase 2C1 n=1 Tax=Lingula anatina TaxID=7574 RepID=A0A2R2MNU6_LINAN|nr:UDP-glucuronosyltransferase 2C1 [Lingula anatina]|eukprot:XP_023931889.1 UDP-glucuronosyltransferase 2C1 [Lingula anatina]